MVCHSQSGGFSLRNRIQDVYAFSSSPIQNEGYQVIRSLEVVNFRCFKSLRLDDVRRFSFITGANASGKIALLESLFISGGNDFEIYIRTDAWRGREAIPVPT